MKEKHLAVLKELGFDIEGKEYEEVVSDLLEEHIKLMQEIEKGNRQTFSEGVRKAFLSVN